MTSEELQFPFCSKRCRAMDLGSWADGRYVVSTPLTAADLLGDADYTMGPVERMPASGVRNEQQIPRQQEDASQSKAQARKAQVRAEPAGETPEPHPRAGTGARSCQSGKRKESHGRKRG